MLPAHPPLPLRRFTKPRTQRFPPFPAHKRPVLDRAVCGFAAIDIAAVLWLPPKHLATIQLPRTKLSFPNPRAASGWLPAAAFHPANPQAEASAKFLVPFSKKGTSFRDGNTRPRTPRYPAPATAHAFLCPAPYSARCVLRPPVYAPPRYGTVAVAYAPFSNWFENRPGYTASAAASAPIHQGAPSITRPGTRLTPPQQNAEAL